MNKNILKKSKKRYLRFVKNWNSSTRIIIPSVFINMRRKKEEDYSFHATVICV